MTQSGLSKNAAPIERRLIEVPRALGVPRCSRSESRKDEIVLVHIRLMAAEARFVLRLVDRLAIDNTADSHPPVAAYRFESVSWSM